MSLHAIQGVLISTDDEVRRALEDPEVRRKLDLVLSFSVPMAGFSAGHLDDLRERGADLILLFGHPRLIAELPGEAPVACAWHRQRPMQEAAARLLSRLIA